MPINFDEKLYFIQSAEDIKNFMSGMEPYPNLCPICNFHISPHFILVHVKWISDHEKLEEVLCGCPRPECNSLFFAEYEHLGHQGDRPYYELIKLYPSAKFDENFAETIAELSPNFVAIYNQARHAEKEGLDLICGVGYRKAIEFLVKDYAIKLNPSNEEDIKKKFLVSCIKEYIPSPNIVFLTERAAWLGNDETHYERKWHEKDVQDLKMLIDLTCKYIDMELTTQKYRLEMSEPRR
ncbi:hypothetical protein [Bacillus pumilus]|uniref:hypothetical protein n=1 Tax=Bacillus pumilus TaxID=1408 RepID=UPI0028564E30|nr:hypothetical protein [Bacillus pumilus]MDR7248951.1 hypothetical protein [Bacillus pumilus]